MMDIEESGCNFEICKLRNVRKNALDFYFASKVGEIFTVDRNARIAIISADSDYRSVIDYWKPRLVNMIMETDQPKILYLNSLKSFGRKSGTEVYRKIKGCVTGVQRVGELEVW